MKFIITSLLLLFALVTYAQERKRGVDIGTRTVPSTTKTLQPKRTASQMDSVFKANRLGLNDCYKAAKVQNPTLKGQIKIRVAIAPSGSVSYVKVLESSSQDATLEKCVTGKVRRLLFPKTEKSVGTQTLDVPLDFNAE
jgi:TonB family protein